MMDLQRTAATAKPTSEQIMAHFDRLLQHARESGCSMTEPGFQAVVLRGQSESRLLPGLLRNMALVPTPLITLFRQLLAGNARWPLYLHGPAGGGKTCAALALCDWVETATYVTTEDLAAAQMSDRGADWQAVQTKGLAVLDELGERERVGDLQHTVVKKFADLREVYAGRVAIYISNLRPSQLPSLYDDRVCSRILSGTRFELAGEDRRCTQ
jgi:hypothetical protein